MVFLYCVGAGVFITKANPVPKSWQTSVLPQCGQRMNATKDMSDMKDMNDIKDMSDKNEKRMYIYI